MHRQQGRHCIERESIFCQGLLQFPLRPLFISTWELRRNRRPYPGSSIPLANNLFFFFSMRGNQLQLQYTGCCVWWSSVVVPVAKRETLCSRVRRAAMICLIYCHLRFRDVRFKFPEIVHKWEKYIVWPHELFFSSFRGRKQFSGYMETICKRHARGVNITLPSSCWRSF